MVGAKLHFTILTPVYNDWEAFDRLIVEIEAVFPADRYDLKLIAVDDCSSTNPRLPKLGGSIAAIDVVRLVINVGHQRAIAVGLAHADLTLQAEPVAVLDSDGEDSPSELLRMIEHHAVDPLVAVVARRRRRSETITFRLFYRLYVAMFRALTGQRIDFGNFCVLPRFHVTRLVHNSNIWNNFPATILQAKLPITRLPTIRGRRYAGQSHMRLVGLVTHGLGAISVFSEAVFVRILMASLTLLALSLMAGTAVAAIKLFTLLAIPGWATNVLGFALLLAVQAVMLPIMVAFLLLNNRASFQSIPKETASRIVEQVDPLYRRGSDAAA